MTSDRNPGTVIEPFSLAILLSLGAIRYQFIRNPSRQPGTAQTAENPHM